MTSLQVNASKVLRNPLLLREKLKSCVIWLFRTLFIIGLCYLFLFPLVYMISTSLQDPSSINDPSVMWVPRSFSLKGIKVALQVLNYVPSMLLTMVITFGSTLATLVSCSLVGYSLARFKYRERNLLFCFVIFTIIIPPQTIQLSSYINFRFFNFGGLLNILSPVTGIDHINLLNTPWTFILPAIFACGLRSGLFIFIFRQFFQGMPKDLEEAAKVDGCNAFVTFVRIIIPLAGSAFITVFLFSFIWHWNDLYSASMYFIDGTKPLSVMLLGIQDNLRSYIPYGASSFALRVYTVSGALLMIFPPLILYVFAQKYFTESIERTGIVG